jgi:hypothetical protein
MAATDQTPVLDPVTFARRVLDDLPALDEAGPRDFAFVAAAATGLSQWTEQAADEGAELEPTAVELPTPSPLVANP